ncbi:MAG: tetratricopeptide repeat protein, partial [Bacteroidetes bacterium]|nr:tetratricopeptide repeat protein [Bacteroidota bacterium]
DLRETNQSAYHLYKQKEKELALQDLENIKEDLAVAFLQRAQRILTKYLSGKPLIGDEKFSEAALDLEKALELLGPTHYLSEELSEKKTFLRCLEIIQTEQFNDYAHIERKLLDLEKANPVAAYINIGLSQLYHKMGKVDQAHEHTKKAHQKVTTWVKPQNVSAQIWLENGHIGQAQALIDQAEAQEMADGSTSLLQAKIKTNQLEMQLAIEQLEKIKSKNLEVSSTEIALLEGTIEAKRGRVKLAETIYKKALVSTPNNLELLSQLADLYREDGDTSSAIRYYDKIVKIKPSHSQAKIYLSSLKGEVTNPLLENYYDTKASLRIVDLYLAKKDYDKSITLLKEAQKFNAYDPAIDYAMAKVFYEKRDMAGAEKYLKIALGKSPYHFESIQSLANIYVLQKKFDETKALLNSSASYFKYSSKWKVFTYETYLKMEKKNNQLFILEEALKLDSTDTEAYKSLYRFHMEEGRYNAAEKEYKQMKRLGSGLKDSSAFIDELIFSVEKRVIMGLKDNRTVEGLKVILKYDRYYLSRMFGLAEEQYMQQNYRDGDINLERFGRYLFCMGKEDKMSYLALKAKMMLEVGMYQQALDLFRQLNEQSYQASYLGVAMAQYELGLKEDTWMANFSRDQNTKGFNSVAIERYRKMSKNKGYYPSGYK